MKKWTFVLQPSFKEKTNSNHDIHCARGTRNPDPEECPDNIEIIAQNVVKNKNE